MDKKVVLFDADGVVIQTEMFSTQYQREFGVAEEEMSPFFKGIFKNCVVGKADLKEVIEPYLKKWKWKGDIESLLQYWFKAEHHVDQQLIDYIQKLRHKNILCFLVTNQEKYRLKYLRNEMNFDNLFDEIFSSCEIGYKKPELKFYEYVLNDLEKRGINKNEILFVDDEDENIQGAKRAKIDAYLYKNFSDFEKFLNVL